MNETTLAGPGLLVVLAASLLACSSDAQATGAASSSTTTHSPSQSEGDLSAAPTSVPDSPQRSWSEQYCAALKTFVYPDLGPGLMAMPPIVPSTEPFFIVRDRECKGSSIHGYEKSA